MKRKSEAFNPVLNENLPCSHAIQSKWNCKGAVLVALGTLLTTDSWVDLCCFGLTNSCMICLLKTYKQYITFELHMKNT
jgi:hypothetical protein